MGLESMEARGKGGRSCMLSSKGDKARSWRSRPRGGSEYLGKRRTGWVKLTLDISVPS